MSAILHGKAAMKQKRQRTSYSPALKSWLWRGVSAFQRSRARKYSKKAVSRRSGLKILRRLPLCMPCTAPCGASLKRSRLITRAMRLNNWSNRRRRRDSQVLLSNARGDQLTKYSLVLRQSVPPHRALADIPERRASRVSDLANRYRPRSVHRAGDWRRPR